MPHKKNFRSDGRRPQARNVSDQKLSVDRKMKKNTKKIIDNADRHIFESNLFGKKKEIRFDYSFNVLSMRGDWESRIKVIALYLPLFVNRERCKKFEELVSKAFESIFMV